MKDILTLALTPDWSRAFANRRSLEHCQPMHQERVITLCGICGAKVCREGIICRECEQAFEPDAGSETVSETVPLDLGKYGSRMFPWEQITTQPRLISVRSVWLILALGLVVLVLLLALLRTPLPSCWELSS